MSTTDPIILPSTPTRPLSPPLRAAILAHLLSPSPPPTQNTSQTPTTTAPQKTKEPFKRTLLTTLHTEAEREHWSEHVYARCFEILESGSASTYKEMKDIIVAESLANFEVPPSGEAKGAAEGEGREGKTDIRISNKVMKAGAKVVVKSMQEKGGWVVEGEETSFPPESYPQLQGQGYRDAGREREWRDWR